MGEVHSLNKCTFETIIGIKEDRLASFDERPRVYSLLLLHQSFNAFFYFVPIFS